MLQYSILSNVSDFGDGPESKALAVISSFSVAVIKYNDPKQLQEERIYFDLWS